MIIYKYSILFDQLVEIELPQDAQILTINAQDGALYLWALVEPQKETEVRYIEIFGTTDLMPNHKRRYINTFFTNNGKASYHAFEAFYKD